MNKIEKSLANLTKMREKMQVSEFRNKEEEITTKSKKIQGIIRDYFENLYFNKLEYIEEWNKF
jgi:hypothetical protein